MQTLDSEGLHAIANTDAADRQADLVFVHGLGGGAHTTWHHKKPGDPAHVFWPSLVAKAIPQVGVWSFGYAAGVTEWGKAAMLIEGRSGNLASQLANHGFGDRPIVFVVHSLGGLVVKGLFISRALEADPDRNRPIQAIRGIVFLGTPHRGSPIASAASRLGGRMIQEHVRQMRAFEETLDRRHDDFMAAVKQRNIHIETFAESRKVVRLFPFIFGLVVPRASANPGVGNVHDVDADHFSLVKPPPSGPVHDTVHLGLIRIVKGILKQTPSADATSTPAVSAENVPARVDPPDLEIRLDEDSCFVGGDERAVTAAFEVNRVRRAGREVRFTLVHAGVALAEQRIAALRGQGTQTERDEGQYRHWMTYADFLSEVLPNLHRALDLVANEDRLRSRGLLAADESLAQIMVGVRNATFCAGTPARWDGNTSPHWLGNAKDRTTHLYLWWRGDPDLSAILEITPDEDDQITDRYRKTSSGLRLFGSSTALDVYALSLASLYGLAIPLIILKIAGRWASRNSVPDDALDLTHWVFSHSPPKHSSIAPPVGSAEFARLRNGQ